MKFRKEELLFFSSVTKSVLPFGLFLKFPKDKTPEEVGNQAVQALQEKRILDEHKKFTKWGTATLMLWESYCNCKKHLILNQVFVGITTEGRAILIQKDGASYEMMSCDSASLMVLLLNQCAFLHGADQRDVVYPTEKCSYETWVKEIKGYGADNLIVGEFDGFEIKQELVYYWDETRGYQYDLNSQCVSQIQPRRMRMQLLELLGVTQRRGMNG